MAKTHANPPRLTNRKAGFHYEILDELEVGIVLTGSEVKSLRAGHASIDEAFAVIDDHGEMYLRDLNIQPYAQAGKVQHKPKRERKLLLHRAEIRKWLAKVTLKGLTLIPLQLYFNERGIVKVRVALARGKKLHDKRESLKAKDARRESDRAARRK
jgi:SsrA-binding protein